MTDCDRADLFYSIVTNSEEALERPLTEGERSALFYLVSLIDLPVTSPAPDRAKWN